MNTFTKRYEEMNPAEKTIFDTVINTPVRVPQFNNVTLYDNMTDEEFINMMKTNSNHVDPKTDDNVSAKTDDNVSAKEKKAILINELMKLDLDNMTINSDGYIIWKKDRMLLRFRVSSRNVKIGVNAMAFKKLNNKFTYVYHDNWKVKYDITSGTPAEIFKTLTTETEQTETEQ